MSFKTPAEAIIAFEQAFEQAWAAHAKGIEMTPEVANIGKGIFRAGFIYGSQFMSNSLIKAVQKHGETHIIEPEQPKS